MPVLPFRFQRTSASFAGLLVAAGCSQTKVERNDTHITRAFVSPVTIAVAPVLNFSGEFSLDPIAAADLLASELTYVEGVTVVPLNRVMAVLAGQGRTQVDSPAHALAVCEALGADAILVGGIMEYDAYTPTVGLILQMYEPNRPPPAAFDSLVDRRLALPFEASRMADPFSPTSQVQLVQNAAHEKVQKAVKKFADPRDEDETHLGWRQYLKVQSLFLRFCWNDALARLMKQERSRRLLLAGGARTEDPA
ncbi:MAG TPA: hypothetical protein VNT79_02775 [Phycisphaerae bacterium]|nr:hypothetical protein [Phycisphaerae bacterium]